LSLHPVDNRCALRLQTSLWRQFGLRAVPSNIFSPSDPFSLSRALAFLSFRAREQLDGCYNIRLVIRQQAAGSRQQAAGSRQQAAGSRQQAAGSRQQAAGSRQQAAGSRQQAVRAGAGWALFERSTCRARFRRRFEPFASGLLRSVRWDRSVEIDQFL
jgi:uncharacterized protein YjbJ (UPF0337 family)